MHTNTYILYIWQPAPCLLTAAVALIIGAPNVCCFIFKSFLVLFLYIFALFSSCYFFLDLMRRQISLYSFIVTYADIDSSTSTLQHKLILEFLITSTNIWFVSFSFNYFVSSRNFLDIVLYIFGLLYLCI